MAITVFFGLWPRDYTFVNETRYTANSRAIRFGRYGLIYSRPFVPDRFFQDDEFSMEMAFEPAPIDSGGFKCILMIHNGHDSQQLMVGQWKSWIIIMNGDDYDNSRKLPRITVRTRPGRIRFLSLVKGKRVTRIYIDGVLKKEIRGRNFLHIPQGKARLLIGNSVYGINGWNGTIYGLAFYNRVLSKSEIKTHYRQWIRDDSLLFARQYEPVHLYLFAKENFSRRIRDLGLAGNDLENPRVMPIFKMNFLYVRTDFKSVGPEFFKDVFINFFGFIPIGFASMLFIYSTGWFSFRKAVFLSFLFCFSISLFIELSQAWLPSRNSDAFDLFFNSLGALTGACLVYLRQVLEEKRRGAEAKEKINHRLIRRG